MNENKLYVKNRAHEIEAYAAGEMKKCPECETVFNIDAVTIDDDQTHITCPECAEEINLDDAFCGIWEYFNDCLDIEYRTDANKNYKSVCVTLAWGGPNVYVDTRTGDVELFWSSDYERDSLTRHAINAIDEYFNDVFDDIC